MSTWSASGPSGQTTRILDRLVEQEIQDETGTVFARTRHFYDDEAFTGGNLGVVAKGNLTMTREWHDPASPGGFVTSARSKYDASGNVTHIYDPLWGSAPGHFRIVTYDTTYKTFPIKEEIFTGNSSSPGASLEISATYDEGFGVIESSTDSNGFTTTYGYDTFARIVSIAKPGDSPSSPTIGYDYVLAHDLGGGALINWVETRQRETAGGGTVDSRTFYDGLGRQVMTRSEGESAGQVVVTDTVVFNARRAPWKQYLPYFEGGGLNFVAPTFNSGFTEHLYDALGREVVVSKPAGAGGGSRPFSRMTYEPLTRQVEDEEQTVVGSQHAGASTRTITDGLLDDAGNGRLRVVEEIVKLSNNGTPGPPTTWTTTYSYDVLDSLKGYVDAQNNAKTIIYDGLRRNVFMDDPDRGVTSYTYDDASNVIETLDANGQRIVYSYDGVNRLLTEDYLDEGLPFSANRSPDVEYHYDVPPSPIDAGDGSQVLATHTKGFLAWVSDLSGEEHTSYDERGRIQWVVKRIPDPASGVLTSYKTEMTYDSLDRVRDLIYPDNDQVTYTYNNRSLLERIVAGPSGNIMQNIDYRASGQLETSSYGNGVVSDYVYDARLRQTMLTTGVAAQPPLIKYEYTFDDASNILGIADLRPASLVTEDDPRRNTQTFSYDDLYRLQNVQYSFSASGTPAGNDGAVLYSYDRIGNMLTKTSTINHIEDGFSVTNLGAMSYGSTGGRSGRNGRNAGDPPGPHALSATGDGRSYTYDDNGNMTSLGTQTLTWDFKDRLASVETDGGVAEYVYDYTDRRILKRVTDSDGAASTSIYVDQYFEVREGQPVKYVFDGLCANIPETLRPLKLV